MSLLLMQQVGLQHSWHGGCR